MTTLPPHPGLSGLAAREATTESGRTAPEERAPDFLDVWGRLTTTPAEVTRAADDDADHEGLTHTEWAAVNARLRTRSALDRVAALNRAYALYDDVEPCGCCGPQLCCCPCHQEER